MRIPQGSIWMGAHWAAIQIDISRPGREVVPCFNRHSPFTVQKRRYTRISF